MHSSSVMGVLADVVVAAVGAAVYYDGALRLSRYVRRPCSDHSVEKKMYVHPSGSISHRGVGYGDVAHTLTCNWGKITFWKTYVQLRPDSAIRGCSQIIPPGDEKGVSPT